ncbi:hypothetical protein GGI22_004136, partial [Coemansia erecta]
MTYEDSKPKTPQHKCYTSSQWANEICLHHHQWLRQYIKAGYQGGIVQTMEDLLAEGMQCTTTMEWLAFREYWPEGQPFHRRLRSCAYMQQQQADQRLVKSIIGNRNPKPAVVIGNWSALMTRFHKPIRGVGMRRMLRRHKLKVVLIDEYCTSQTCPACDGKLKKFLRVPNPRPFRAKK